MIELSDGLTTRLKAIEEITTFVQYTDFYKMEDQGDRPSLYWWGELVRETISDLEKELDKLHDNYREEVLLSCLRRNWNFPS